MMNESSVSNNRYICQQIGKKLNLVVLEFRSLTAKATGQMSTMDRSTARKPRSVNDDLQKAATHQQGSHSA